MKKVKPPKQRVHKPYLFVVGEWLRYKPYTDYPHLQLYVISFRYVNGNGTRKYYVLSYAPGHAPPDRHEDVGLIQEESSLTPMSGWTQVSEDLY